MDKKPRDVIVDTIIDNGWVEDDHDVYQYADKIINDLNRQGYRIETRALQVDRK